MAQFPKPTTQPTEEAMRQDPLWRLLRQSPAPQTRPSFVDDTVRAARLANSPATTARRNLRWAIPTALAAVATLAFVITHFDTPQLAPTASYTVSGELPTLDDMDEFVRQTAVEFASENPADFSDMELVSLILP